MQAVESAPHTNLESDPIETRRWRMKLTGKYLRVTGPYLVIVLDEVQELCYYRLNTFGSSFVVVVKKVYDFKQRIWTEKIITELNFGTTVRGRFGPKNQPSNNRFRRLISTDSKLPSWVIPFLLKEIGELIHHQGVTRRFGIECLVVSSKKELEVKKVVYKEIKELAINIDPTNSVLMELMEGFIQETEKRDRARLENRLGGFIGSLRRLLSGYKNPLRSRGYPRGITNALKLFSLARNKPFLQKEFLARICWSLSHPNWLLQPLRDSGLIDDETYRFCCSRPRPISLEEGQSWMTSAESDDFYGFYNFLVRKIRSRPGSYRLSF